MSGSFVGFSEDDIKKLAIGAAQTRRITETGIGKAMLKTHRRNNQTVERTKILSDKIKKPQLEPVAEEARLTPSSSEDRSTDPVLASVEVPTVETCSNHSEPAPEIQGVLTERKIDLDLFQAKQKLIEEQNRKRKELLAKALDAKTKQTAEEALRLNEIRNEFKKLDDLLSNDVGILRKQIEVASLDYMEAQKKYLRVEKEFLDAKLALHQKLERKELLTEHLCAIIEKNEERKAQKLNELLSKLNLKADLDGDQLEAAKEETK